MDSSDSKITFDNAGVCDHCKTYENNILPTWSPDNYQHKELVALIENIKKSGKNKPFDCIVGMSGGIDSSYLLHLTVKEFGLRPLVFHVDGGWNSSEAVNNIENMVEKLGVDLFTEVINWKEMQDLQVAFLKSGVPHADTPQDHAFFATMYKFANEYNIKHILTGANYSTECIRNPISWMYYQSDVVQIKDIYKKFGKGELKTFPLTNILWHKIYLPYVRGIKVVKPLNLIPYKKTDAVKLLIEKYDYQPYPQKHFESRFTKFYEGYWLLKKFGFDTRKVQFSSLILTGQMSRPEAIEELSHSPLSDIEATAEFEFVADKLDLTTEELNIIFNSENKDFSCYKNIYWIYKLGTAISHFLGLEKGGKR